MQYRILAEPLCLNPKDRFSIIRNHHPIFQNHHTLYKSPSSSPSSSSSSLKKKNYIHILGKKREMKKITFQNMETMFYLVMGILIVGGLLCIIIGGSKWSDSAYAKNPAKSKKTGIIVTSVGLGAFCLGIVASIIWYSVKHRNDPSYVTKHSY